MNDIRETGDDALRWQLRGLRRDLPPARDLWPDISARIAAAPTQPAKAPHRRPAWLPLALAASLLLAIGVFRPSGMQPAMPAGDPLIQREAVALSRQYRGAFAELARSAPAPAAEASVFAPAIRDLDDSAAQILAAIQRSPDSRLLLDQLRRTYARRLALTQRATFA